MFIEILAVFALIFDNKKSLDLKEALIIPIYSFKSGLAFISLLFAVGEPVIADLNH